MAGDWEFLTLEEAGVRLLDCVHKTPVAVSLGLPYVAIPQMKNGEIDLSEARKISPADFGEWTKKANPQPYDIVLSRRCNPGETAYVRPGMQFALGQNLVLLRADGKRVIPQFLRWIVKSPQWWEEIEKFRNVGAVFDSLRCADVPRFKLPFPQKHEQKAIADVLSALDDKIELNRRMNETLEGIARTLFKDWFIDFGPVKAKAAGQQPPGLVPDIAALFPDSLEEGIPEGWNWSTIGQEVSVCGGGTPSTKEPSYWLDGNINWATPKDLSKLETPVLLATERKITEEGLKKISSGLLPAGTLLLSSRAPIGYLAISEIPVAINQGFIAMGCNKSISNIFAYYWCKENMEAIENNGNGSTFQEISKTNFRPIPLLLPSPPILRTFDEVAQPLYQQIVSNAQENNVLTKLRDTLLPKLISGEVRVQDAERQLGAVL